MCRSLPIDRTTTSPAFSPTRMWMGTPCVRCTSAAYCMRQRRPKQGHDAVAHDLVDGAFVLVHGRHHAVEHRIEQLPRLLWVALGQQLHGPLEVGEEHRDLLAFAFQGGMRGEDLLGQMWRGVRHGHPFL